MKNRITQLDALRGVAALMVVGYHYTTRYQELFGHPTPLFFQLSIGHYGVQLFFMISGFVILMTLENTSDYRDFILSRASRLYPAYWSAILITYFTTSTFSLPGREISLKALLINFTMFQEWFGIPSVDGVYWSLMVELMFYAIMLAIFISGQLKNIELFTVVWLMSAAITRGLEITGLLVLPPILKSILILNYANLFVAGIMFYKLYFGKGIKQAYIILIASLGVEFFMYGLEAGLVCSFFFLVFYLFVMKAPILTRLLSMDILVFFGSISYGLYLVHQNIGYVILRALYARNFSVAFSIPIAVSVSLLLATAINRWIENPARKSIRAYWQRSRFKYNPRLISK